MASLFVMLITRRPHGRSLAISISSLIALHVTEVVFQGHLSRQVALLSGRHPRSFRLHLPCCAGHGGRALALGRGASDSDLLNMSVFPVPARENPESLNQASTRFAIKSHDPLRRKSCRWSSGSGRTEVVTRNKRSTSSSLHRRKMLGCCCELI